MSNNLEVFENVVIEYLREKKFEEKILEEAVNQLGSMPLFDDLSEEEKTGVIRRIKSNHFITLNSGSIIQAKGHEKWYLARKASIEADFWDAYKSYLLKDKKFPLNVVLKLEGILDDLTDLLGDPLIDNSFQRRGLIVGDVQSGKTTNYLGLMCKAADAKYKLIVVLAGTIESLRSQTQERIDEGFLGFISGFGREKIQTRVGVGKYSPKVGGISLTSTKNDFKKGNDTGFTIENQRINVPVVFVVKKNVSVLRRLLKWLETQNHGEIINQPLLMIDDEADNASVNTNPDETDPTKTNNLIREILSKFSKASYVGYTATPYANIFIDPESENEMQIQDLFPKDYIFALDSPSNYIGARDIFDDESSHSNMIVEISDNVDEFIPVKSKTDSIIKGIPESLKESIRYFVLVNAIRNMRGDANAHSTMLINVNRLVNIQTQVTEYVAEYLEVLKNSIKLNHKMPRHVADSNMIIQEVKRTFITYLNDIEFTWGTIFENLNAAIQPIVVITVNQKSAKKLNYGEYSKDGLKVIAIGGISLSRGLTLEGLSVSYFYRNSKAYDTLMQMGRWFGYRPNYADLCKLWITEESREWYSSINDATEELRTDIKKYQDSGLTPLDFGIRVRRDISTLTVTALNKMRTARNVQIKISLAGENIETVNIFSDRKVNEQNYKILKRVLSDIEKSNHKKSTQGATKGYLGVSRTKIIELLGELNFPISSNGFELETLRNFINGLVNFDRWDIAIASGESETTVNLGSYNVNCVERSFSIINPQMIKMSGSKSRLGSTNHMKFGLSENQIVTLQKEFLKYHQTKKNFTAKAYLDTENRNPLLVVYMVMLKAKIDDADQVNIVEQLSDQPIMGISLGFPKARSIVNQSVEYSINRIYQEQLDLGDSWNDDEE